MKTMLFLLVGTLAACQSWQASAPDQKGPPPHRGVGTGAGMSGTMGSGTASGTGEGADAGTGREQGMCALHQQMMAARTPEERQAIAEQAMPNMAQESRERHLRIMQERCP